MRIVLDTNVLRAALHSASGASFHLLRNLPRADVTVQGDAAHVWGPEALKAGAGK